MKQGAEEFRKKAAQCEECAKEVHDPAVKQQYLEVAQQRRVLAEQAEKTGLF